MTKDQAWQNLQAIVGTAQIQVSQYAIIAQSMAVLHAAIFPPASEGDSDDKAPEPQVFDPYMP